MSCNARHNKSLVRDSAQKNAPLPTARALWNKVIMMKRRIIISILIVITIPFIFLQGYNMGAEHQQGLDAPAKAALITLAIDLYENNDDRAYMHMLTYLDTELSFYEEYLDTGIPLIARLTEHSSYIQNNESYLKYVTDIIYSNNDGSNKYKQDVSERLNSIDNKIHNKSLNLTGAENAPSS